MGGSMHAATCDRAAPATHAGSCCCTQTQAYPLTWHAPHKAGAAPQINHLFIRVGAHVKALRHAPRAHKHRAAAGERVGQHGARRGAAAHPVRHVAHERGQEELHREEHGGISSDAETLHGVRQRKAQPQQHAQRTVLVDATTVLVSAAGMPAANGVNTQPPSGSTLCGS